jgi:isopenicillin N synthase-like dioxygenase
MAMSLSSTHPLPVFSLAAFESADEAGRAALALDFRRACRDSGFLYLVDHGIAPALIDEVLAQSRRFFDLPEAQKQRVAMANSPCHRGYEPLLGQTLEPGALPDLKEGYYIGEELAADDPRVVAGLFNHGPNLWPEDLPGWREAMERYFAAMTDLCARIMRALALSLELPADHFDDFCRDPMTTLRLLHYPPQPAQPRPGEKGCGAHTDFGALTLLLQDGVGGLQVFDEDRGWIDAPPMTGAFVVNLGDLIARWTNDRYRSTLHRVINTSGKERYSVPFFFTGRADHEVACLATCLEAGETPRYAPTTAIGHLEAMYARTYGGLAGA